MAASALAQPAEMPLARPPRRAVLWAVGLAGCAAAAGVAGITLGIDEPAPGLDAVIVSWIVLAYVACGLVAWSRRPESRFGRLMVAAGFGPLLARLSELDAGLPQTIGEIGRLLPVVLFLHVFLAAPGTAAAPRRSPRSTSGASSPSSTRHCSTSNSQEVGDEVTLLLGAELGRVEVVGQSLVRTFSRPTKRRMRSD
jgi:hypothetical protein